MNGIDQQWEQLNRYVDGELSPDEAATVAEAVARSPELAREIAALTALKAAVGDAAPSYPGRLDDAPRPRRAWLWLATAASMLVVGLLLSTVWFNGLHRPAPGHELALQLHLDWAARQGRDETMEPTRVGLDALQLAYVPDLTQVELAFDGVRQVDVRGGRGLHVGYLGPRGCAVSLVVFREPGRRNAPLAAFEYPDHTAWSWMVGGASFYLLAPRMDPDRLAGIARVVQRLTRARLPLDAAGVLAMERARSDAEPCLA